MTKKKSDSAKKNNPATAKRSAGKTAAGARRSVAKAPATGKPRAAGPAAPRKRTGKRGRETVIPVGTETPLSESKRSLPSSDGQPSPEFSRRPVSVVAKIDVGFGNALFIRGQGAGLSWESGIPLECRDGQDWIWSGDTSEPIEFKLLLNDADWDAGENHVAKPGDRVECEPRFG